MDTLTAFRAETKIEGYHRTALLAFHFLGNVQSQILCHLLHWLLDVLHRLLDGSLSSA
jgi:hypothetical protein